MSELAARRHLPLSEGMFHGYGMVARLGQADAAADAGPVLAQARAAALRMLDLLAAGPEYLHHFSSALAWLACRQGDAELATTLLAGGQRLKQSKHITADRLDLRFVALVQAALPAGLDGSTLQRARAAGRTTVA